MTGRGISLAGEVGGPPLPADAGIGRPAAPDIKPRVALDPDRPSRHDMKRLCVEGKNGYALVLQQLRKEKAP